MWTEIDDVAAEAEMGEFLYGFVQMLKPDLVVETGTYKGHSSFLIFEALLANESGKLISCDIEEYPRIFQTSDKCVEFRICSSLDLPELKEADFVFSDSDQNLRQKEYKLVKPGCVFVVHDTARSYTTNTNQQWLGDWVRAEGGLTFNAGRGFGILIKK